MLDLVTLPDERLFVKSTAVLSIDDALLEFIDEMIGTMNDANGVGLAAVQVGLLHRLFIVHAPKDELRIFINPTIELISDRANVYEEGCLSIPGVYSDVERPDALRIKALNQSGNEFQLDAEDFLARVIQHEFDHLEGQLFYQHLSVRKQDRFLKIYEKNNGVSTAHLRSVVSA